MTIVSNKSRVLAQLGARSLADVIPGFERVAFEEGKVEYVSKGDAVCREGERAVDYFMPLSSGLRLVKRNPDDSLRRTGFLLKGRSLGLGILLHEQSYPYTALAEEETLVLRIPGAVIQESLRAIPHVKRYLKLITVSPGLRALKASLASQGLGPTDLVTIISEAVTEEPFRPGTLIPLDEPRLYALQEGLLQAEGREGVDNAQAVLLKPGAWFGGETLVAPHVATYEVSCMQQSVLQRIDLSLVQERIDKLGIQDFLYTEPSIASARALSVPDVSLHGVTGESPFRELRWDVSLPGEVLDEAQARRLKLSRLSPRLSIKATSDEASFRTSIVNIALMRRVELSATSVQTQLKMSRSISFLRIAEVLEPHGFATRIASTDDKSLKRMSLPGLIMVGPRLCILVRAPNFRGEVVVHDPIRGYVLVDAKELRKLWDGTMLKVETVPMISTVPPHEKAKNSKTEIAVKTKDESAKDRRRAVRKEFERHVLNSKWLLASALMISFGLLGLNMLMPLFSQGILDEVLTLRDLDTLWSYITGMLLIVVFLFVGSVTRSLVLAEFGYRFDHQFSVRFYRHALSLPSSFHENEKPGDTLTRIREIQAVREFFSEVSVSSIVDLLSILVYSIVLFFYSWKVAVIPLALIPLSLGTRKIFGPAMNRAYDASFRHTTKAQSLIAEQVSSMATLKAVGAERVSQEAWEKAFLERVLANRRAMIHESSVSGIVGLLSKFSQLAGIFLASSVALSGDMSLGELFAVTMYLGLVVSAVGNVSSVFGRLEELKVSLEKLGDIFLSEEETTREQAATAVTRELRGKIRFEKVSFRYDADTPWIFENISFTIFPRQVVALVGRSGCGKSTLANLIAGNLKPTSGRIFFDDFDISFLSREARRKQLGFIIQSSQLFAGSIASNIAFSDTSPDQQWMEEVSKQSNATEFVEKFPTAYKQFLAEAGLGLSGGQGQRLNIARTLYRVPKILIMDEATSALDSSSEREVLGNMTKWMAGKTAIIIAHRLSTIRSADRILVMKDGELVEDGSHASLLKAGRHYAELFQDQEA